MLASSTFSISFCRSRRWLWRWPLICVVRPTFRKGLEASNEMSLDDAHPSYFSVQRDHRPWKANRGAAAAAANSDGSRNVFIITHRYTHTHTAVQTPSSGRAAARFTFVPIDLPLPPLFFFPRSGEISGPYFRLLGWGFTQNNHNYPLASFFLNFPEGEYLHDSTLPLEGSQTFQNGAQAKLPVVLTPAEEEFTSKTIVGLFGFRHTRTRTRNGIFLENFFSFSISANPFSSGFSALEKSKCFFLCFVSFGHNLAHKSFKK